jgi:hypothetical protein
MKSIVSILFLIGAFHFSYAQIVDIPDPNFKNALVNTLCVDIDHDGVYDVGVDTNNDGEIQVSEAEAVDNLYLNNLSINSMVGIEAFTQLIDLSCNGNNLSSLDLTNNLYLEELITAWNNLTVVDFGANINLRSIILHDNLIAQINLSQNTGLISIVINNNLLNTIDVSQQIDLLGLSISNNNLTSLDLSNNLDFNQLSCSNNPLVGTLDLSHLNGFRTLICDNTLLSNINIKNGNNINMQRMWAHDNPNLICLQVDDVAYANNQECDITGTDGWCKDETANYSEDCLLGFTEQSLKNALLSYPNPVKDKLNFSLDKEVVIHKISIYDVLGKLILTEYSPLNSIDITKLDSGLLFLKIETNKGVITKKIIKE